MLILTRRMGETIKIGDDIEIAILGMNGKQVRIGVKAPKEVQVHREEIYNKIKEEGFNEALRTPRKVSSENSGQQLSFQQQRPGYGENNLTSHSLRKKKRKRKVLSISSSFNS